MTRDVAANGTRLQYRAWRADDRSANRRARPKTSKRRRCGRLRAAIEQVLRRRWSPQQIAARLIADYPAVVEMRVSQETIDQSQFVQSRGALRRELAQCLR